MPPGNRYQAWSLTIPGCGIRALGGDNRGSLMGTTKGGGGGTGEMTQQLRVLLLFQREDPHQVAPNHL